MRGACGVGCLWGGVWGAGCGVRGWITRDEKTIALIFLVGLRDEGELYVLGVPGRFPGTKTVSIIFRGGQGTLEVDQA